MPIKRLFLDLNFDDAPSALLTFLDALDKWLMKMCKDSSLRDYRICIEGLSPAVVDWAEEPEDEEDINKVS